MPNIDLDLLIKMTGLTPISCLYINNHYVCAYFTTEQVERGYRIWRASLPKKIKVELRPYDKKKKNKSKQ